MAKATWKMPEEFLMKVSRLADKTDEIIPKVLEAGAEAVSYTHLDVYKRQING